MEKAATLKATRATERENYMLDLMTNASQYMTGEPLISILISDVFLLLTTNHSAISFNLGSKNELVVLSSFKIVLPKLERSSISAEVHWPWCKMLCFLGTRSLRNLLN
jgi:hypothetical protein